MDITIQPDTGKGVIPQMPLEPPKEAKEMVFSTEHLNTVLGKEPGQSTITIDGKEIKEEKPLIKEEVRKEESVKKEEVKKEDKAENKVEEKKLEPLIKPPKEEKKEEKKEEVKVESRPEVIKEDKKEVKKIDQLISPVKPTDDTFDYAKYNQEEQHVLKNMNRTSREYVSKLMEKVKTVPELEKGLYLQHENAYVISPEFQALRQKEYFLRKEHAAFEDALINIRAGKPFKVPTKYDDNGNLLLSEERTAGDKDQISIEAQLAGYIQQIGAVNSQIREMPVKYREFVNNGLKAIEDERKNRFAWAQDSKLLDYTVETEHGEVPIKKVIEDFVNIWPSYLRNDPGVRVCADMFVALQIRTAELKRALNSSTKEEIKKDEEQLVEPSSDIRTVDVVKKKINGKEIPEKFSLKGMPGR
jgi:hypothetical protein